MFVDVLAGKMAEEQLHRDQHRRHPQAPVQHDLGLGAMDVAEHVPRPGCGDIAVVRNAASSMCGQRTIITAPSTISRQSAG